MKNWKLSLIRLFIGLIFIFLVFKFSSDTFSSCWQGGGGCWDGLVVGTVLLIFIYPIKLIFSFVYNLIYRRIPSQNSNQSLEVDESSSKFDLKRSIISIGALITIFLVLFFGYWMIRDNLDAQSNREWDDQSILCVKLVESQTIESEKCDGNLNPLKNNCIRVGINESKTGGGSEDHYVNEELYLNCMNQN